MFDKGVNQSILTINIYFDYDITLNTCLAPIQSSILLVVMETIMSTHVISCKNIQPAWPVVTLGILK